MSDNNNNKKNKMKRMPYDIVNGSWTVSESEGHGQDMGDVWEVVPDAHSRRHHLRMCHHHSHLLNEDTMRERNGCVWWTSTRISSRDEWCFLVSWYPFMQSVYLWVDEVWALDFQNVRSNGHIRATRCSMKKRNQMGKSVIIQNPSNVHIQLKGPSLAICVW